MRKERADVRLEPELLVELDAIAQRKGQSRSEAIRDAIACFVDEEKDGWNSVGVHINIGFEAAEIIDTAIEIGDATTVDIAIEKALDFWGKDREDHHINRKPKMDEIAKRKAKERAALKQMQSAGKQLARK